MLRIPAAVGLLWHGAPTVSALCRASEDFWLQDVIVGPWIVGGF
jgi:hypothetical protein